MRLNKFLALGMGIGRRKADVVIQNGEVRVNSEKGELGMEVHEKDRVEWKGKVVKLPLEKIVVGINKPEGVIVSHRKQSPNEKLVFDLLPEKWWDLKFVGRLDQETVGLLLLTNDGEMNEELTHPRFGHEKEYVVKSAFPIEVEQVQKLNEGVELEDGLAICREVNLRGKNELSLVLVEGRKRIVRRMCQKVGIKIEELERVRMGGLRLSDLGLERGESKELTKAEIEKLMK